MKTVYLDTETEPVAHDQQAPKFVCATWAVDDGPVQFSYDPKPCRLAMREADQVVGHSLAFDLASLRYSPGDEKLRDTAIRATLLDAARGAPNGQSHQLKTLAKKVGIEMFGKKTIQLSFRQGQECTEEQIRYAKQDVEATRAVFKAQPEGDVSPDETRQTRWSLGIYRMARRGVRIDQERLGHVMEAARLSTELLRVRLKDVGLLRLTGPKRAQKLSLDTKRLQERLAAAGVLAKTDGGERLVSDADTCRATRDPVLRLYADYQHAIKWQGLVEAYDVGPILRASYKTIVASGRISASEPNITQIPRRGGIREVLIPRPGHKLVCVDFPSLEFRCWADICHRLGVTDEPMKVYQRGLDPHLWVAAVLVGDSYANVVTRYKLRDPAIWGAEGARQKCKIVNYGAIGGVGKNTLAEQLGVMPFEAQRVIEAFKSAFQAQSYFNWLDQQAAGWGMLKVSLPWSGRQRKSYFSAVANYMIQGTGSDVAKLALDYCERVGNPMVALIHDELIADVPEADVERVRNSMLTEMAAAGKVVSPSVPWDGFEAEVLDRWHSK